MAGNTIKLYITGIMGMLGYNLAKSLCGRCQVTGVDLIDMKSTSIDYLRASLYDMETIEQHIRSVKPDVLVHTAALVNVDECEKNPAAAEELNVEVTKRLAFLCSRMRIKLLYISTDAVFDGREERLYAETDTPNPMNVYGRTKLEGEEIVLKCSENLVFRTNIYGKNIQDKQSFGEWIYTSLLQGKRLSMFSDIDFSPILTDELAELVYAACQKDLCGLYHACATGCITKYEFAVRLKEIFGIKTGEIIPAHSDDAGMEAKRAKHMGLCNKKLSEELNLHISTPIESIYSFYGLMGGQDAD